MLALLSPGTWKHEKSEGHEDYGLLVSEKAKKYGIAVDLPERVDPKDGALVLQYDLRLQDGLECGGAYLKFLQPQVRFVGLYMAGLDDYYQSSSFIILHPARNRMLLKISILRN